MRTKARPTYNFGPWNWNQHAPALLLATLLAASSASALPPANFLYDDGPPGGGGGGGGAVAAPDKEAREKKVIITRLERNSGKEENSGRGEPWLGVGAEEAPEALSSQLQLNSGEGLVVTFVSTNSPAAKAGLQKNDVLVKLDDQLLVHPAQLRKLVRSHKEGDKVQVTAYRRGEKLTVSATLEKAPTGFAFSIDDRGWQGNLNELQRRWEVMPMEGMAHLKETLAKAGIDKEAITVEIRRSVEEAQKAARDALRSATNARQSLLGELARAGVDIDKNTRLVVKSHAGQTRNMVRTDDSGTYVLVANPKKHLTVHDKDGKLLFDGPVETEADQEKVPAEVWSKAKKMVDQLDLPAKTEPEEEIETETETESQ